MPVLCPFGRKEKRVSQSSPVLPFAQPSLVLPVRPWSLSPLVRLYARSSRRAVSATRSMSDVVSTRI